VELVISKYINFVIVLCDWKVLY